MSPPRLVDLEYPQVIEVLFRRLAIYSKLVPWCLLSTPTGLFTLDTLGAASGPYILARASGRAPIMKETAMSFYALQASYTPVAWTGLVNAPANRLEAV